MFKAAEAPPGAPDDAPFPPEDGLRGRLRTCDLPVPNGARYQTALREERMCGHGVFPGCPGFRTDVKLLWGERSDSNRRMQGSQPCALTWLGDVHPEEVSSDSAA